MIRKWKTGDSNFLDSVTLVISINQIDRRLGKILKLIRTRTKKKKQNKTNRTAIEKQCFNEHAKWILGQGRLAGIQNRCSSGCVLTISETAVTRPCVVNQTAESRETLAFSFQRHRKKNGLFSFARYWLPVLLICCLPFKFRKLLTPVAQPTASSFRPFARISFQYDMELPSTL